MGSPIQGSQELRGTVDFVIRPTAASVGRAVHNCPAAIRIGGKGGEQCSSSKIVSDDRHAASGPDESGSHCRDVPSAAQPTRLDHEAAFAIDRDAMPRHCRPNRNNPASRYNPRRELLRLVPQRPVPEGQP